MKLVDDRVVQGACVGGASVLGSSQLALSSSRATLALLLHLANTFSFPCKTFAVPNSRALLSALFLFELRLLRHSRHASRDDPEQP